MDDFDIGPDRALAVDPLSLRCAFGKLRSIGWG
jgi:hypothetical protein